MFIGPVVKGTLAATTLPPPPHHHHHPHPALASNLHLPPSLQELTLIWFSIVEHEQGQEQDQEQEEEED